MTARELLGLVSLVLGILILPLGWIVSHKILLLASLILCIGAWLFFTERLLKKELGKESSDISNSGPHVPADVNNYTGWRTGGRTQPLDSNSSEGGADAD